MNRLVFMSRAKEFQGVTDAQLSYIINGFGLFGDGFSYHDAKNAADSAFWNAFVNSGEWD